MNCVATGSVIFTPDSGGASITPDQWGQIHAAIHTSVRHAGIRPVRPIGCDLAALHGGLRNKPASQTCINTPSSSIGSRSCVLARRDSFLPFR